VAGTVIYGGGGPAMGGPRAARVGRRDAERGVTMGMVMFFRARAVAIAAAGTAETVEPAA
jgi:hypothetical protein